MDNGAQKSVPEINSYPGYCKNAHFTPSLVPGKDHFKSGVDRYSNLLTAIIRMPMDEQRKFLEFPINVTNTNEVEYTLCKDESYPLTVPLAFKKGHLYFEWPDYVILFTKIELEILHRRFL